MLLRYKISKEDDNILEVEEDNSRRIFLFSFLIIFFGIPLVYILLTPGTPETPCTKPTSESEPLLMVFGILAAFITLVGYLSDIFTKGYIRINKKKKEVYFFIGLRKILFSSPLVIPFSQIRCLTIEIHKRGEENIPHDVLLLQRINKDDIIICRTDSEKDINEISSKIARYIGCEVYCDSLPTW